MEFVDVLFPINLGPLTYKCPEHLIDKAHPGMLVSAPLKKQITKGIIFGRPGRLAEESKSSAPISDNIKNISDIHGESPLLEPPLLKLLNWMADYYIIANKGLVLKNMLPQETFKKVKARKSANPPSPPFSKGGMGGFFDENTLSKINTATSKREYKTFLVHAPSPLYESAMVAKILPQGKSAIILVPEIVHISHVLPFIKGTAGERLCVLHSGLSKGQRSEAMEKIISGQCNVVLGTRMAVFAPLKNVSLISVMQEHSSSYRTEEGLRFNARDIAVMRGYLEKAAVVLSSVCPSIESVYNSKRNKYTLIRPDLYPQRPKIRILNMRNERQPAPNLSKTVINEALSSIRKNEKIMFVINRKGYSMLTCKECGSTETCGKCSIPLMFYKGDKSLRCHYCGTTSASPEKCRRCGSFSLEPAGSGIERVEENIKKIFDIEPLRIDSNMLKRKRIPEDLSDITEGKPLILGTKLLTKRLHSSEKLGMAAVLNADSYLNQPDFRSAERTFHEMYGITDKIKPGGSLFIQTRMPQNYIFRHLKNYDYVSFCDEELEKRKEMLYPPFSKLAVVTFNGKDYDDNKVKGAVKKICDGNEGIEILGPSLSLTKKGQKEYALLIKTASKKKLQSAAREFLKMSEGYKDLKVSVAIDA
ncbi:MAG: primosomal protein N' [Nitrospirae bacterium CG_4_10_14_3_um_filter_44_29]|nr:primosomal protein N' [Nitrospirota bacterium]PIP70180.1 MAG: primosomal protein N' [Nitrospirae bacterium CG22_combo_CG10-13_8_21_14_all_44_11]PIV40219.1 MAG: primosomal protein N' [Nitrospirae bacterium CG02_land_8_20_14_3_00_44_33]PIX88352.1 MAG: primosomal protein N' [Nitrospirae bacterium CG_4_10_14_3_um_filter_44_29]PJA81655.1 MAG: primosomal protein N' [Nitrospirae bacterium CG_4_9_14_3_um_filter_44_28]